MTIRGRVIKLERRQIEREEARFYFVASEEVAARERLSRYLVTDDPSDDPPVHCMLTHEEIVDELDREEFRHASA